jgi:hypothetical protein
MATAENAEILNLTAKAGDRARIKRFPAFLFRQADPAWSPNEIARWFKRTFRKYMPTHTEFRLVEKSQ